MICGQRNPRAPPSDGGVAVCGCVLQFSRHGSREELQRLGFGVNARFGGGIWVDGRGLRLEGFHGVEGMMLRGFGFDV
jgi:hypothetical protein